MAALRERGTLTVSALTEELEASAATVRRDLADLDARGALRRTHGGARRVALQGIEVPFADRSDQGALAKARMAEAVADRLLPGEAVLLDSGTSCLAVAQAVRDQHLTVTPLSLQVANHLSEAPHIHLVLPGGEMRPGEQSFVGPLAESSVRHLNFDTVVISGCAASLTRGVTAHDLASAQIKSTALASGTRAILLCDEAKWDTVAFAQVAPLSAFTLLVTDHLLDQAETAYCADHDIDVVTV